MTAKEMVLAYWGYGKDYDPNDLSEELREHMIATINLMHEWERHQLKKVKADAAAYEIEIELLNNRLATALLSIATYEKLINRHGQKTL